MARPPRAEELRHSLSVESVTDTRNAESGDIDQVWTSILETRAALNPLTGREIFDRDQTHAEQTHRIVFRDPHTVTITPKMRGKVGSRVFEFLSAMDLGERNEWIVIRAKEQV